VAGERHASRFPPVEATPAWACTDIDVRKELL
jgi:hypothetical protein